MHLGVILPNFGERSTPGAIRQIAEAAEQLGFDSVWATEHIIVGPEAVDPYGRVYAPLVTLGWIAGFTERIALGTSIVLAPLHHPIHLAKEAATLQELSGGRMLLGLGMGWHEDEYRFMGIPFRGRGRRGDEAIRLIRALWNGEREFHGEIWSFDGANSARYQIHRRRSGSRGALPRRFEGPASSGTSGIRAEARTRSRCGISRRSNRSFVSSRGRKSNS